MSQISSRARKIVIIGTAARGGVKAVIDSYLSAGFYTPDHAMFLATHTEGSVMRRIRVALYALLRMLMLLISRRVELLHIHMSSNGSFWRKSLFVLPGRVFGVPIVIHLHGGGFVDFYESGPNWKKYCVRTVFDLANAIVVLSKYWQDFVRPLTSTPVSIISNFVADNYDSGRAERERQHRHILFLGQFGMLKGIYDLLPVFVEVAKRIPNARLVCAGNGEVERVRRMVNDLDAADYITVPGWVSGEDKLALLHRCSVFVLPSYNEGLPMAIIEAMSYGMAVVSTRVGGIPELVDEDNGAVVTPGDRQALTEALLRVLEDDRAAALGAESRRRYEKGLSPQAVLGQMRSLYLSLGVEP